MYITFPFFLNFIHLKNVVSIFSPPAFLVISRAFVSGILNVATTNPKAAHAIVNAIPSQVNFNNVQCVAHFCLIHQNRLYKNVIFIY